MKLLRSALAVGAALLLTRVIPAAEKGAANPKPPNPMIGSTVFKWDALEVHRTDKGERRDVANNPTPTLAVFESHITTLNPGQASHLPHRHPQEELIIVKEGTLEVHINGATQVTGPGSTLLYLSNDAHAVKNVGPARATYWVINVASTITPTPEKYNAAPTLHSAVFDYEKLPVKASKVGESRAVLNGSTRTLKNLETHITSVRSGEASHAAHRHPDEEIILVRSGQVEATINGQAQVGGPGSVFFFASNDLHGMRNVGDTLATYHVIRFVTEATPKAEGAK